MGMLTGPEILKQMELGNIVIDPFDPSLLNPNSVNLRMGDELLVYVLEPRPLDRETGAGIGEFYMDMKREPAVMRLKIPPEGRILEPGVLYIGHTKEYTETRNFVPCIEGRSSVARLGMCVHITAGFGDEGFCGQWTTEITVVHPLRVYPDVPICQIVYSTVVGESMPYKGKYSGNRGPHASKLWKDFLPASKPSSEPSEPSPSQAPRT
jgi:dCTP deaminase